MVGQSIPSIYIQPQRYIYLPRVVAIILGSVDFPTVLLYYIQYQLDTCQIKKFLTADSIIL